MPVPTPFHSRTRALCSSYSWKDWAGYYAVRSYDTTHENEYFAFRNSSGLLDITPLFKYEVHGPDAAALLSRMTVRDLSGLPVGRMAYCCWCDDDGNIVDDGTVARLDEEYFRLTSTDPAFHWLTQLARGFDVTVDDSTERIAAVALQGPTSREILRECCDADVDSLRYFGVVPCRIGDLLVWLSRTGYTGDLGYEIWVANDGAIRLWDALMEAGKPFGITPAGLDALDMTRIEAGFILQGVDYFSAPRVIIPTRKSSPYELGLGWMVQLDREAFIGQAALRKEAERGSTWQLVGLALNWEELESLYESYGLPPNLPARASRDPLPVYGEGRQVGQATSHAWSPLLKKSIALASVRTEFAEPGRSLKIEHTVEYERSQVTALVCHLPFFNPERKRRP